ncbi:MAG TPA: hypothetical protein VMQ65_04060 [Candidatus Limnocylindria bacterium]|nr:hypothetical protein [Candidatus Limnocylindria bacterium]
MPDPAPRPAPESNPRPLIERIGLGAIALVLAVAFGVISVAALAGGELFLGVMAGTGALMTLWAAAITLLRG